MKQGWRAVLGGVLLAAACGVAGARDWPQAGGNPQHTNSTPDSPAPPYKAVWVADFSPEQIYSAQPVIADGRVFQTTLNGSLYALDAATGKRLWDFRAGECVWGSAAAGSAETGGAGLVFVAAWDGLVYALDSATGQERWRYDADEPLSASPCLADGLLFLGTRKGTLLALTADGHLKWRRPLSWQVFSTAACDAGKVFVVTEDMHAHCLDAKTGEPVWKSLKLRGLCFREFYPVVHGGKVFISVTPAEWLGGFSVRPFVWDPKKAELDQLSAPIDAKADKPTAPRRSLLRDGKLPPELEEAQLKLIEFYAKSPQFQTFHVLNAADGQPAYTPVHMYGSAGLQNVIMPPAVCSDGTLVMYCMIGGARLARFDPGRNRWTDFLFELVGTNNDESEFDSVGGTRLFSKNTMRANGVLDLATREWTPLPSPGVPAVRVSRLPAAYSPALELSGGRLGSDWHGSTVGMCPMPIAGKRVFWMRQSQRLVAYEGR